MISLILTVAVMVVLTGAIVWALKKFGPNNEATTLGVWVILVIAVICIVVYVANAFGVVGRDIPVPQL